MLRQHRRDFGLPPIGLIAGWGHFPIEVAREIVRSGRSVVCIAIHGHADPQLESICDHVLWSGVGKIGRHLRYFRNHRCQQVAMAGKLFKSDILYQGSVVLRHLPDWAAIKTFGPLLLGRKRDARDDRLLTAVTETYDRAGLRVCPATDYAPELLVKKNFLAGPRINPRVWSDIGFGVQVAKTMGGFDIGQTVAIKDGTVIAVEAIEGTDACIQRCGELCRRGGWVLVKMSKPNQDMRFDVPTIGPQTLEKVSQSGGIAIAIESNLTIVVQREETMRLAKRLGVAIVAVDVDAVMQSRAA
ncbi:MAG: UDP-2,3-diacylglucosamine diphosphatase LpxI [Planctomycetota bacterium]